MTTKQLKALAARRYEYIEPINQKHLDGHRDTYKVICVFKDTSFLTRIQEELDKKEKG